MLRRHSERRPATGGLGGEGALKLLGRPHLDPLVVLVREAVQNSWDARANDDTPVEFELGIRTMSSRESELLRTQVFESMPDKGVFAGGHGSGRELGDVLADDGVPILTLTDRGTHGLGGPVRADVAPTQDEPTDFIDLVFNIGQPPDKDLGGGTYGFGKTIAYLVSSCRTVLIHSRTMCRGRWQHRLIAQTIGNQYRLRDGTYTGRHWWGVPAPGSVIEPLTGQAARELSERVGLPSFGAGGGTTIAVIDPDLSGRTPEQAANFLANAIAWNFWPKMIADQPSPPTMTFRVLLDGRETAIPDPESTPPLSLFVDALRIARDAEAHLGRSDSGLTRIEEIHSRRPRAYLGRAVVVKGPTLNRQILDEGVDEDDKPVTAAAITEPSHHIALMRTAELVVQYKPGPSLPSSDVEWAGVFRSSVEADGAFAESEPPTHDSWHPKLVATSADRTKVNVAIREIDGLIKEEFTPVPVVEAPTPGASPVLVAERLGGLLLPSAGTGATKPEPPSRPKPGATRRVAHIEIGRQAVDIEDGRRVLRIPFDVAAAAGTTETEITASVWAAAGDGARESDPPAGAPLPRVLRFEQDGFIHDHENGQLVIGADWGEDWTVVIELPPGVALAMDIRPGHRRDGSAA